MSISIAPVYKRIIQEEVQMSTQPTTQVVQWQDFEVMSEVDLVLKIAQQNGWKDCKFFGYGDMIPEPQESQGWELIPADLYEYSIPAEGVDRILRIVNAGVRIQGVIIADDKRKTRHLHIPTKPVVALLSARTVVSSIGEALRGLIGTAGALVRGLIGITSAVLRGLIVIAGVVVLGLIVVAIIKILPAVLVLAFVLIFGAGLSYDPALIILVDDGNGGTAWVSVFTWFD
jgi:hypothetical protein